MCIRDRLGTVPVGLDQIEIGIGPLRIFIKRALVRVGRQGIEIEVGFLDVLAVIALLIGQAEESFLEDRIDAVPQDGRKAEAALAVREPQETCLLYTSQRLKKPKRPTRPLRPRLKRNRSIERASSARWSHCSAERVTISTNIKSIPM